MTNTPQLLRSNPYPCPSHSKPRSRAQARTEKPTSAVLERGRTKYPKSQPRRDINERQHRNEPSRVGNNHTDCQLRRMTHARRIESPTGGWNFLRRRHEDRPKRSLNFPAPLPLGRKWYTLKNRYRNRKSLERQNPESYPNYSISPRQQPRHRHCSRWNKEILRQVKLRLDKRAPRSN